MRVTTNSAFESTLRKTNVWLGEISKELDWNDSGDERAYRALRAVLHALRDRLTVEESSDFSAQLPMLVRGFYYEGWNPSKTPVRARKLDEFLFVVAEEFANDISVDVEQITRAVFKVIGRHVTSGEIEDVKQSLPKSIRNLWD